MYESLPLYHCFSFVCLFVSVPHIDVLVGMNICVSVHVLCLYVPVGVHTCVNMHVLCICHCGCSCMPYCVCVL